MRTLRITKLGVALALLTAVAAPLAMTAPASADELRVERLDAHHDFGPHDQFGHRRSADYEHMRFREHVRFQPHRWNWNHRGDMRDDR
jgi:hypothetical protein